MSDILIKNRGVIRKQTYLPVDRRTHTSAFTKIVWSPDLNTFNISNMNELF